MEGLRLRHLGGELAVVTGHLGLEHDHRAAFVERARGGGDETAPDGPQERRAWRSSGADSTAADRRTSPPNVCVQNGRR